MFYDKIKVIHYNMGLIEFKSGNTLGSMNLFYTLFLFHLRHKVLRMGRAYLYKVNFSVMSAFKHCEM